MRCLVRGFADLSLIVFFFCVLCWCLPSLPSIGQTTVFHIYLSKHTHTKNRCYEVVRWCERPVSLFHSHTLCDELMGHPFMYLWMQAFAVIDPGHLETALPRLPGFYFNICKFGLHIVVSQREPQSHFSASPVDPVSPHTEAA